MPKTEKPPQVNINGEIVILSPDMKILGEELQNHLETRIDYKSGETDSSTCPFDFYKNEDGVIIGLNRSSRKSA